MCEVVQAVYTEVYSVDQQHHDLRWFQGGLQFCMESKWVDFQSPEVLINDTVLWLFTLEICYILLWLTGKRYKVQIQ